MDTAGDNVEDCVNEHGKFVDLERGLVATAIESALNRAVLYHMEEEGKNEYLLNREQKPMAITVVRAMMRRAAHMSYGEMSEEVAAEAAVHAVKNVAECDVQGIADKHKSDYIDFSTQHIVQDDTVGVDTRTVPHSSIVPDITACDGRAENEVKDGDVELGLRAENELLYWASVQSLEEPKKSIMSVGHERVAKLINPTDQVANSMGNLSVGLKMVTGVTNSTDQVMKSMIMSVGHELVAKLTNPTDQLLNSRDNISAEHVMVAKVTSPTAQVMKGKEDGRLCGVMAASGMRENVSSAVFNKEYKVGNSETAYKQ